MRFRLHWTAAAAILAVAMLPMKAGGCGGKTVCITMGAANFQANGGVCPSSAAATEFFSRDCFGDIESVSGEGVFDGQFCCYPAEARPSGTLISACDVGGFGGLGGFGGSGGFGGFGGDGGFGGVAGAGGMACLSCGEQIAFGDEFTFVCPEFSDTWSQLQACGCGPSCAMPCSATLCQGASADAPCAECLEIACLDELNLCTGGL